MEHPETVDRREWLRRVAALIGGSLAAPAVLAVMHGMRAHAASAEPVLLSPARLDVVAEIAEILIPRTDTPGAKDVGVPAFIDRILADAYPPAQRQRYLEGLEAFATAARELHGTEFLALPRAEREAFVLAAQTAALAPGGGMPPDWEERPFILMTRELTLLGYFTSEAGATQVLQYEAVPGAWQACLPIARAGNGRTWAGDVSVPF